MVEYDDALWPLDQEHRSTSLVCLRSGHVYPFVRRAFFTFAHNYQGWPPCLQVPARLARTAPARVGWTWEQGARNATRGCRS